MNTFGSGVKCPEASGRNGYVSMVCEDGTRPGNPSLTASHMCPQGHQCLNTTYATPCQAGFFCPRGTNSSTRCYDDIYLGTAVQRCPGGSDSEPIYAGSTIAAIEIVIAGLLILEAIGICYDRKRPLPPSMQNQGGGGGMDNESLFPRANDFLHLRLDHVTFHIGQDRTLYDLSMSLREGEMCALMGESGSGKTTLLNVLGGRASYGTVSGEISLNGLPFEPGHVNVGFVPQQYLLFKELTVRENLVYSAALRLDRNVPKAQRETIVDACIDLLGLNKCRDFVCDKNLTKARLSGGQLRRVGIGIELVTLPTILLLDEPTSALDAVNTRLVVQALGTLARRGILVIASLHQPRFSVYQMIDTLMVLRQGEFILAGPREEALPFMEANGYVPPEGENPADFFIEVAFGFCTSTKKIKETELPEKLRKHVKAREDKVKDYQGKCAPVSYEQFEGWFNHTYGTKLNPACCLSAWDRASAIDAISEADKKHADENGMMQASRIHGLNQNVLEKRTVHTDGEQKNGWGRTKLEAANRVRWDNLRLVIDHWQLRPRTMPRTLTQFFMCGTRYALRQMRVRRMFASQCILFICLGALCGGIMSPSPKVQVAPIFLILISSAFSCVVGTTSLTSLGEGALERDFFRHEAALGVFQAGEVLSRMILDLWTLVPLPLLFAAPLLGLTALHVTLVDMFIHLFSIAWAYTSIGYVTALMSPSNAAVVYVAVAFVLATFFAGAFGITVKSQVDKPGLGYPWVPCQYELACNGTTNLTLDGEYTDGYHNTDGYGMFTYMPGMWGLFGFQMLWAQGLPFAEVRDNVIFEQKASFGYLPSNRDHAVMYETDEVDWKNAARFHLFLFGLALRLYAIVTFVARNYTLGEACTEFKILLRTPIQTLRTLRLLAAAARKITKDFGRMLDRDGDGELTLSDFMPLKGINVSKTVDTVKGASSAITDVGAGVANVGKNLRGSVMGANPMLGGASKNTADPNDDPTSTQLKWLKKTESEGEGQSSPPTNLRQSPKIKRRETPPEEEANGSKI